MKKLLFSLFLVGIFAFSYAQGWRQGEMQVVVNVANPQQVQALYHAGIDFEAIDASSLRAYVVQKELDKISSLGLNYSIEVEDLNKLSAELLSLKDAYHSYDEIIELADSLAQEFPDICERYVFGMDQTGQYELTALKISDNVETDEPEAEVMFDGGIHGDEIGGAENVIRFARDLCVGYGSDPDITDLIDNREIWLYLMVNPWGRENMTRYNANGVDLNRDWCYMWDQWGGSPGPCSQDESKALRECMYNNQFVVHTTFHSGTEYISYPWSYRPDSPPDYSHINQLAALYSTTSGYSNLPYGSGYNGMYAINGSTKDSNYGIMGSISWSIEISNSKQPPASQIMLYYNRNYPSMMKLIEYSGYGLEGMVTDANTGEPVQAVVFVNDYLPTFNDPEVGDYHKYVLPGTYDITIVANGYETMTIENVSVSANNATETNFELQPVDGHYVYRLSSCQIPDNNYADEGWTPAVIGAPDNINYSIGKDGWCVLDMQYAIPDGPGSDFIVHEGDASAEGFTCYVGETLDGPWISLGTGSGTTEFDLASGNVTEAQFIKIVDDGDGAATASDAGFDLDAIEVLESISGVYIALYDYAIDDSQGNNNGMIDPGETVDIIVNLKNNGDAIAENTTGIISTGSAFITIDNNTANFGSLNQGQSGEGTFTITASPSTPMGQPAVLNLVVDANGGAYNATFALGISIGHIVEDWESGTMTEFDWVTGGSGNWAISTESPYEGAYCIKSGAIDDEQSTYLSITFDVLAAGEVGFFKKVSSEATYDFLRFYIDDVMIDQWSGTVSWSEATYDVTSGPHTFKWAYEKDQSVSNGSDCAWVDYITLPAGAITALTAGFVANETEICTNTILNFTDMSVGDVISWEWSFEGGSPATSTNQNPMVAYLNAGTFDVSLTVSDGDDTQTFTATDYINVLVEPETPDMPDGPDQVVSMPGDTEDYTTNEVVSATDYVWEITEGAGELIQNGTECTVDWTDWYVGMVSLKVKAINDCGESVFSEELWIGVLATDVAENGALELSIIPNPASETIRLEWPNLQSENTHIIITDNVGKMVYDNDLSGVDQTEINVSNLNTGLYFVIIKNGEDLIRQKLMIK
ncbi:MAG TPA: M14 family zinc carboxypeptidase [Bacteroidales bacterium]|nr:M14 family zinc carboxypeptidase [Bacteroidales bacterium]